MRVISYHEFIEELVGSARRAGYVLNSLELGRYSDGTNTIAVKFTVSQVAGRLQFLSGLDEAQQEKEPQP